MGAKINLRYHLVLVSKYRRDSFKSIESSVIEAIEESQVGSVFKIEKIAVEDGNHVHIVIRTTGTYSLASQVRRLKMLSTKKLYEKELSHLKNFYWSKKKLLWNRGYYAATVGDVSVEKVEEYLKKQGCWK